jgi:hypothetical protein
VVTPQGQGCGHTSQGRGSSSAHSHHHTRLHTCARQQAREHMTVSAIGYATYGWMQG